MWCLLLPEVLLDYGIQAEASDSALWKFIASNWTAMQDNVCWTIRNGATISVWNDNWISPSLKLCNIVQNIPSDLSQLWVDELVNGEGSWDLRNISNLIPLEIVNRILAHVPPNLENGIDLKLWPSNSQGDFHSL